MGLMQFDPFWAIQEHQANRCELLHVVSGRMDLVVGDKRIAAEKGQTLIVPSSTMHRDEFDLEEGLDIFYVSLYWSAEEDYFKLLSLENPVNLEDRARADVAGLFERLRRDIIGFGVEDNLVARSRVLTILLLILRDALLKGQVGEAESQSATEASYAKQYQTLTDRAKKYLRANLAQVITLEQVATHLKVSPYHLSHVFSQESDFSMFSHLTMLRMEKAKILLASQKQNISEIAYNVGYVDPNYFSKAFKKYAGTSPRDYMAAMK